MFNELKGLIEKDKPSCVFAYVSDFAKQRAKINALPDSEQAALMCDAASRSSENSIERLLLKGIDINISDYDKRAALHIAADNGDLSIVKYLVKKGATVDIADRWGNTPYSGAVQKGFAEVAHFLKTSGAKNITQNNDDGATQLCAAAGSGNLAKLQDIIHSGVAADASDYDDRGALHLAAEEGHMSIIKYLVEEAGVSVNVQDRWGTTPLTGAENAEESEIALYLRTKGGKRTGEMALKRRSSFNLVANSQNDLIKAAANADVEELRRLITNGADVDDHDYDHRYPLHLAAEEGHMEAVKILVEANATLDVKDRWGTTPLRGAIRNTHNDIADFLKDAGATTDKFHEPRSYQTNVRSTRNFFDAIGGSVGFPKSEVIPLEALAMKLNTEFGMRVSDHPLLKAEVLQIARSMDDELVVQFLSANQAAKDAIDEFHVPTWDDFCQGKVFLYEDFADLVLHVHGEHDPVGSMKFAQETTLVSEVVLDKLAIKNWDAFRTNLRQLYEDVLETPNDGNNADYIPELRDAPSDRFAVSICTTHGQRLNFGDTEGLFSVQSVGKTFAYTRALRLHGHEFVHKHVGQEPSGRAFNDFALTRQGTPFNPVTNAGAIVTCSMLDPEIEGVEERLMPYKNFVKDMAGGMEVGDCMDVYQSEQECAFRNYALANFMKAEETFPAHVDTHEKLSDSVEFYLRVCSTKVGTPLLANVAATYANYGTSPLTGKALMTETEVKQTLQILSACGMYDYSGEWACRIGMPAKSGVSGEIFVVVPGVLGMCVWSPKLDAIGNSVRAIRLCEMFANKFRFSVLDLLFRTKDS